LRLLRCQPNPETSGSESVSVCAPPPPPFVLNSSSGTKRASCGTEQAGRGNEGRERGLASPKQARELSSSAPRLRKQGNCGRRSRRPSPPSAPPRSERARGGIRRSGPQLNPRERPSSGAEVAPPGSALPRRRLRWTSPRAEARRAAGGGGGKRKRASEGGRGGSEAERREAEKAVVAVVENPATRVRACPRGPVLADVKTSQPHWIPPRCRDRRGVRPPRLADARALHVADPVWTPRTRETLRGGARWTRVPLRLARCSGAAAACGRSRSCLCVRLCFLFSLLFFSLRLPLSAAGACCSPCLVPNSRVANSAQCHPEYSTSFVFLW
jgi:hypothetical protein